MNSPGMRDTFLYCLGLLYWCFGQSLLVWVDVNFWHWFICVCVNLHVVSLMCWSEDNLEKPVLFPTCGFKDQAQVTGLDNKCLYLLRQPSCRPPLVDYLKITTGTKRSSHFTMKWSIYNSMTPLWTTGSYSIRHSKGYHLFTKSPTTGCAPWGQELGCTHV